MNAAEHADGRAGDPAGTHGIRFLFDPNDPGALARRRDIRTALLAFALTYGLLMSMAGAHAETGGTGLLSGIVGGVSGSTTTWLSDFSAAGKAAFIALATLEITWCAILWAFEKDSLGGIMGDMVKSIMTIAFFYAIMMNAPTWIPQIHAYFTGISTEKLSAPTDPDTILGQGFVAGAYVWANLLNPVVIFAGLVEQLKALIIAFFTIIIHILAEIMKTVANPLALVDPNAIAQRLTDLVEPMIQPIVTICQIILWGFGSWAIASLAALGVIICYAIIAIQLVLLQVEMALLMAAGAVLLALGGSRWTRDYVQKYLNHALVTGIRYLVLMMVLSLTMGLEQNPIEATMGAVNSLTSNITSPTTDTAGAMNVSISAMGVVILILLKCWLAIKAPDLAGSLFSGGSALTASSLGDTTMAIVGAAATAIGMPATIAGGAEGLQKIASGEVKEALGNAAKGIPTSENSSAKAMRLQGGGLSSP